MHHADRFDLGNYPRHIYFFFMQGIYFLLGLNLFIADGWVGVLVFPGQPQLVDVLSNSVTAGISKYLAPPVAESPPSFHCL
jgi:hypothetical protein